MKLNARLALILLATLGQASPLLRRQECSAQGVGFDVEAVVAVAKNRSSHSWEYGTAAEMLLELYNPELSVFGPDPFPDGEIPRPDPNSVQSLSYARPFIRTNAPDLIDGDGAIGDPASLGVSALLLGQDYFAATDRQTQTVLNAPRWNNGAISHRADVAELWADFIYMAPPYLAYYAVHKGDQDLLKEAVRQCGLYRDVLGQGWIWKHIEGPQIPDPGRWSTGNSWAAMGMARVLATVRGWKTSCSWSDEIGQLEGWIQEILDGAKAANLDGGLLRNYIDDESWFGETSGTALLAATIYRMASMNPTRFGTEYTDWAEAVREELPNRIGSDGIVAPAVNPLGWGDRNPYLDGSPEGQSFAGLLAAAWRDWGC